MRCFEDNRHWVLRAKCNSWLEKLASPAAILTLTLILSAVTAVLMCHIPPVYENTTKDGMEAIGRAFQESKWYFAGTFAVFFSLVYPFFDATLDIVWLYEARKRTITDSKLGDLKGKKKKKMKSSDVFIETTFLVERWILILIVMFTSLLILIYMDANRDPMTLMNIILIQKSVLSFVVTGCMLSVLRQSSNFCTKETTILVWTSMMAFELVLIWSHSFTLMIIMLVISMLALSYPIFLSLRAHYFKEIHNAESQLPYDEIDSKKRSFVNSIIGLFYFVLVCNQFIDAFRCIATMSHSHDDFEDFVENSSIFNFAVASVGPLIILLCNPKRLYYRWQEEKMQFLYKHSTQLLEGLLPAKVLAHFRQSKEPFVERFDCVTILFADIMDYTVVCRLLSPSQVLLLLDKIFAQFDKAALLRGVYRVETVGDCYMASTGCPDAEDPSVAAEKMLLFAQDINQIIHDFQPLFDLGFPLQIRIGVHSGPVTAGTLSGKMPRYCLFGDTVNTAARMESNGEVGRIHLSEDTVSLVRKGTNGSHDFKSRLPMHIKGKGVMSTYFLDAPENRVSTPDYSRCHSYSEPEESDPYIFLKSLTLPFFFFAGQTGQIKTDIDGSYRGNSYAAATTREGESNSSVVVPSNEDPELGMVANPEPSPRINMAFVVASSLLSWDFDVQNIVSKDMLVDIAFMIFKLSWLGDPLGVSDITLRNFIENVAETYNRRSFHNLQHAVSVLHVTALLTSYCNQKDLKGSGTLSLLSKFTLLVGALVHDCDHPGHTNSFEVNTNSAKTQKYGSVSVLEHHHLAVTESILAKAGCNILESFDEETTTMFKDLLKHIVLGTDMSFHKEIVSDIDNFSFEVDPTSRATIFTLSRFILHAADLSNPVRTFDISKAFAIRLADEYTKQVQAEAALGLPSAQFMVHKDTLSVYKGEIGFFTYTAQPLWAAMAKTWPHLSSLLEQLQLNIRKYQDLISKASEDELTILTSEV